MCGEIFNNCFIANCPQNVPVKKFWKSVNIWRRYRQSQNKTFFETQCIRSTLSNSFCYLRLGFDIRWQPGVANVLFKINAICIARGRSSQPKANFIEHSRHWRLHIDRRQVDNCTFTPANKPTCDNCDDRM